MAPLPAFTAAMTPDVPVAASPPLSAQVSTGPLGQVLGAALVRYSVKFLVVPDLSLRCTGAMARTGRGGRELSAAIAGSFHLAIEPEKILATVSGFRSSVATPGTL